MISVTEVNTPLPTAVHPQRTKAVDGSHQLHYVNNRRDITVLSHADEADGDVCLRAGSVSDVQDMNASNLSGRRHNVREPVSVTLLICGAQPPEFTPPSF